MYFLSLLLVAQGCIAQSQWGRNAATASYGLSSCPNSEELENCFRDSHATAGGCIGQLFSDPKFKRCSQSSRFNGINNRWLQLSELWHSYFTRCMDTPDILIKQPSMFSPVYSPKSSEKALQVPGLACFNQIQGAIDKCHSKAIESCTKYSKCYNSYEVMATRNWKRNMGVKQDRAVVRCYDF